ncbi:MAG TPA: cytochrome c [Candidatus Obscuribacterales bacterium]
MSRNFAAPLGFFAATVLFLSACSMGEEVKRIKAVKELEKQREASRSTDLTGEQIFIRSCNTCHPHGEKGMGPSLEHVNEHFPDDAMLKRFIRQGKGIMMPQPPEALNDKELDQLVKYLRAMQVK